MNDSKVKTTQKNFQHTSFHYFYILSSAGWCWYFTLFSCFERDFHGYFTLLMSDNMGVMLISLFTMDFHKTSAFQWNLGPLGQRLSAFWLTLHCYSCWRNMWTAPYIVKMLAFHKYKYIYPLSLYITCYDGSRSWVGHKKIIFITHINACEK